MKILKKLFEAKLENLKGCLDFINDGLQQLNVERDKISKALLSAEETINKLVEKSTKNDKIKIEVIKAFGSVKVKLTCKGEAFKKSDIISTESFRLNMDLDPEEEIAIKNLISKVTGDDLKVGNVHCINKCTITISESPYDKIIVTVAAIILGVLFGVISKFVLPQEILNFISDNILEIIYTVFINALKMIVAPVVFLSIATSVAGFDEIKSLGIVALKTFIIFVATSVIAIVLAYLMYNTFPIGDESLKSLVSDSASQIIDAGKQSNITFKSFVLEIVPSDIINPFLTSNTIQIIFMGILLGYAILVVGNDKIFSSWIFSTNEVVFAIVVAITKFLPLAIFCSMSRMIINIDIASFAKVIVWIPLCIVTHLSLLIVYSILLIINGYNPIKFFVDFSPAMITAFSTISSNATLPVSLDVCEKRLKIPRKYYMFCIPLGATMNMNGSCATLMISSLFMMKIFGIAITPAVVTNLAVSIVVFAMGAPGIPGASLACLSLLLPSIGIPAEAVSIIMGIYLLSSMTQTMVNVTGDAMTTMIVAKKDMKR